MNVSRRRYMGEKGGSSPYQRIEYLECTGKQYIDLGFNPTDNFQSVFKIYRDANSVRFDCGAQIDWGETSVRFLILERGSAYYNYGINASLLGVTASSNLIGDISVTINRNYIQLENVTSGNTYSKNYSISQAFSPDYKFLLFSFGYSQISTATQCNGCRLYYFKATDTNVNLDLVPVRIGQAGYLYDINSGTLFGKVGTEDFVLGPDVNE